MENKTCKECTYFRQHYILDEERILRVFCGHCTRPRAKGKRPYNPACEHFEQALPDEAAFVSKEYLGKELLRYMMNLELLPDIRDMEDKIG